jgi:hypothetical protein
MNLKKCIPELLPKVNENELEEMCPIYWRNETVGGTSKLKEKLIDHKRVHKFGEEMIYCKSLIMI